MVYIKKVVSECCDPAGRYYWILFKINNSPHSLVYDSKNEDLLNWRIFTSEKKFDNEIDRYTDNSGDTLSLYPVDRTNIVYCWFIADKENAKKEIEKSIIESLI